MARFYLSSIGVSDITPVVRGAFTHGLSTAAVIRPLQDSSSFTPPTGPFTTVTLTPDVADHLTSGRVLVGQFLTVPLMAQTINAQIAALTILCAEAHANNNLVLYWHVYALAPNGTVRGTLINGRSSGVEVNTTLQSRTDSVMTTAVTIQDYDRLVLEIGFNGTPSSAAGIQGHNGSMRFGYDPSGANLDPNDTATTDGNPYLEIPGVATYGVTFPAPTTYRAAIARTSGVVGYWRLGETAGTVAVDEAGLANGTYTNGPTLNQPGALADDTNRAVLFDGVNDIVITGPQHRFSGYAEFTVEAWIKQTAISTTVWPIIAGCIEYATNPLGWALLLNKDTNELQLERHFGDGTAMRASTDPISVGVWHHVACAYNGSVSQFFLDGVAITTYQGTNGLLAPATSSFAIGGGHFSPTSNPFPGLIDEVAIYDVALSVEQIQPHYVMGAGAPKSSSGTATFQGRGTISAVSPIHTSGTAAFQGRASIAATGVHGGLGAATVQARGTINATTRKGGISTALLRARGYGTSASDAPRAGTASFTRTPGVALTPGLPLEWVPNDIHLLLVSVNSSVPTLATPAGWTLLQEVVYGGGDSIDAWLFWRRAQAGDVAPSLAFGDNAIVNPRGARIYGVRGVPPSEVDPFDVWSWRTDDPTPSTLLFTDVTTTGLFEPVLALAAWAENPSTASPMNGWNLPPDGLATFGPTPTGDSTTALTDDPLIVVDAATAPGAMLAHQSRTNAEPGAAGATALSIADVSVGAAGYATFVVAFKTPYAVPQTIGGAGGIGSGEAFGATVTAPGPVAILPAGIATAEVHGAPTLIPGAVTIQGIGIPSLQALGAPTLLRGTVAVLPIGLVSTEAFGTVFIPLVVTPLGLATQEGFGTPLVAPGAVVVAPTGLVTLEAFGAASLLRGAVTIQLPGVASAEAFGALSLALGAVTLLPSGLATVEAFGLGSLSVGAVLLLPAGIATTEQVEPPILTTYTWLVTDIIPSEEVFGTPDVTSLVVVTPSGIGGLEAVGAPVLTTLALVLPSGIATLELVGAPLLIPGGVVLLPTGLASPEGFGLTVVQSGAFYIATTTIPSGEAFGGGLVIPGVATLLPLGVGSSEAFGATSLVLVVTPSGLLSLEAFGGATLAIGAPIIDPVGIVSVELFGDGAVSVGEVTLLLDGVASDEVFGLPALQYRQDVLLDGLLSGEAFGPTLIVPGVSLILPPSIVSVDLFGLPLLVPGATPIVVPGIAPSETFGLLTVEAPALLLVVAIPGSEQFGSPAVLIALLVKRVIRVAAVDSAWGHAHSTSEALGVSAATDRDYGRTKALDAPG